MTHSLDVMFDPKRNALNSLRLLLAISVIVWHSFPLTGAARPAPAVTQLLGDGGVDGFFAISGFLIVSSWTRRPDAWAYLKARFLRILPAFWVCLIVTAGVIAPIGVRLGGQDLPDGYAMDAVSYVARNAALVITQIGIAGTPAGVPYPGVWNGSLWTLSWEFACYLGVLALGLSRLLRFRLTIPLVFAICLVGTVLADTGRVHNFYLTNGSRFGLMFAAGALLFQFRRVVPARWYLVGIAAAIVAGSSALGDYRLVAALPLAYLLITTGALLRARALRLRNDVSYGTYIYAFPLQQLLAGAGLYTAGVAVFASLAVPLTLAVATLSWFAVEQPAMRLRDRTRTAVPIGAARRSADDNGPHRRGGGQTLPDLDSNQEPAG